MLKCFKCSKGFLNCSFILISKILLIAGLVSGLFYFKINPKTGAVRISRFLLLYGLMFGIFVLTVTPRSIYFVLKLDEAKLSDLNILVLASIMEFYSQYLITCSGYFIFITKMRLYKSIVIQGLAIYQKGLCLRTEWFHKENLFIYRMILKITSLSVLSFSSLSFFMAHYFNNDYNLLRYFLNLTLLNCINSMLNNAFIWGIMLAAHLYRSINNEIIYIAQKIDNMDRFDIGKCCELSDNIDSLNVFHSEVTQYTRDLNNLFEMHNLSMFLNVFITIVAQVLYEWSALIPNYKCPSSISIPGLYFLHRNLHKYQTWLWGCTFRTIQESILYIHNGHSTLLQGLCHKWASQTCKIHW